MHSKTNVGRAIIIKHLNRTPKTLPNNRNSISASKKGSALRVQNELVCVRILPYN